MYPDNRNAAPHQPLNNPYDSGDDQTDFQGTLLDPYWGNQGYRQHYNNAQDESMSTKSKMWLVAALLGIVAIGFAVAFMVVSKGGSAGDVPIITADATPYKSKPSNPGGIEIPFQDKLVFNRLTPDGQPVQAERLLPPAEQPVDLALQPDMKKPSDKVPPMPMATDKAAAAKVAAANVVDVKPQLEKIAPTEGAVPPPVTDVMKTPTPSPAMPVAKVDDLTTTPSIPTAPVAAAPKAEAPVKKVEAKTTPAPTVSGGTRIQLASIPDRAAAEKALAKLQAQYGSTGVSLTLVKADIPNKGTFWRVQSQPMDKAKAQKVCETVKSQGGACITAK